MVKRPVGFCKDLPLIHIGSWSLNMALYAVNVLVPRITGLRNLYWE